MLSESSGVTSSDRPQPSRLKLNAPSFIQVNPIPTWNAAIPLLSPVPRASSPPSINRMTTTEKREEPPHQEKKTKETENLVFKMWQHPALPFYCEPSPIFTSFAPV
ncbi:hypothetical protein like AT1G04330 [Hibiscus trionum]|uniref:Uncharacterized protein n=1 Tax=Hibiscus trionum TaxID=183268 RepID=A0A9W7J5B3_HIBTR|nr:hypothetical protein like AT1G04330 [Hibiscus trionum]